MLGVMHSPAISRLLRRFCLFCSTLVVLCCVLIAPATAQDTPQQEITELTLGVLAAEGATRALEAWTPTVSLLNRAAVRQDLPYRFRLEPHTDASLIEELGKGEVDLFLADPATYVAAEVEESARALLSVAHMWDGMTYDQTGALVFVSSGSDIRSFDAIAGRRVMGVAANELTGWKLALQEARKYRLRPESIASDLLFSGGNQREVVYAVQNGLVDVGVIRAGVLEALAQQGTIKMEDFRPIAPISHEGYPFWVSTPLYPDWVMGALPDVPDEALALLIDTLLSVRDTSPEAQAAGGVVWQAPQNYQNVHELLISLRARPYENYLRQAAARIYRAYKWPVLGLGTLIVLSILFLAIELRRNAQLAEARKNVLQSEVRSKQFYRNAIEDHTVFCMLTKDGMISHVNKRLLSALDRTRSSLVHNPLSEILDASNQDMLETQIMDAMKAGVPWQGALQLVKRDGNAAWVQCTFIPVTSASEKLSEIAIVASDVTQTRAGVSEKRFNNTLELIQDQVIVLRPGNLEILYVNAAAEDRLIEDRIGGSWTGKKAEDFITAADLEALRMRAEALAAGPQRRVTWEVEAKHDVTYEISLEYAQPDQDEPRLIAIYRDVSERKAIEKAKNEFIATVSHELRTPLTSMKGALGLALSGTVGEMPEKMNGMIKMASSNCDRLVVLINDILDLEKIEAGKMDFDMKVVDLNEIVSTAMESNQFYAEKFGIELRRIEETGDEPMLTYADPARLAQVMDNVLSNAAKFSASGSEILVSLKKVTGRLRITVRDFGVGIPEKAQATVFEKFTQADSSDARAKGGTGLGLPIVKLIVEHHQGRVSFVTKPDVGTEFFIDLPLAAGDGVVPMPAAPRHIEIPMRFSDDTSTNVAVVPDMMGQLVVQRLVGQARKTGLDAGYEFDQITAQQLAAGQGAQGEALPVTWFGAEERALLSGMLAEGQMTDRPVCLIEINQGHDAGNSSTKRGVVMAELVQEWLEECKDLTEGETVPRLLAVAGEGPLRASLNEMSIATASEGARIAPHMQLSRNDLIAQFGAAADQVSLALYPVEGGVLPADWPLIVIASRIAGTQSGQGVVSKFSSGGGGRGRRRAS